MTARPPADSTHPLVAIVTPVYNGGRYLREAMKAVQDQTYPNLVHVVLNNASTDDTADIIAEFSDAKVPLIVGRNETLLPLYDNWNAAFDLVPDDAAYVRLLCADDNMHPDCTSRMVAVAEADPEVLVVCTNVMWNDTPYWRMWPEGVTSIDGPELVRGYFRNEMSFFAIHMLMRRSAMDMRKPLFDSYFTGADFEVVLALLKNGGRFGVVDEHLGFIRDHSESQTATVATKKNTHFADWLSALHRHGPDVFERSEFEQLARRFERHYLRKALAWRSKYGGEFAQFHFDRLANVRGALTAGDYAGALYDWALIKIGVRPYWKGYPDVYIPSPDDDTSATVAGQKS